jgi:type IV pilus assembly protein PilQ
MLFKLFPFNKKIIVNNVVLIFGLIILSFHIAKASEKNVEIISVISQNFDEKIEVNIKGSGSIISTIYELPNPERVVVDIANAEFSKEFSNQIKSNVIDLQTKELKEANPSILRFEFTLKEKLSYDTKKIDDTIKIVFNKKNGKEEAAGSINTQNYIEKNSVALPGEQGGKDKISNVIGIHKNIDTQLPEIKPLNSYLSPKAKEQQMQDAFNFSGYNKERITVEFQKMDLHNVFNFLRQVSGVNIVVDESVQGSLTLVLDEVPWDFALDIILNLKDLEKEERFNTLVIYPKDKKFKWPDQAQNNLSFQADSQVVEQETLIIKQQERQPVEAAEAKQYIALAKDAEKQENFEIAVQHYEKALNKWPENSRLANQIASLYLVQLRQNAKALYYAKIALDKDNGNVNASLNAAIASANMQDKQQAITYFNQSTKAQKPAKEALLSYAFFKEEQRAYGDALQLLEKHNTLYGEDLNSLVSVARIHDKMGKQQQATESYKKVLLSGFNLPPDLAKYIKGRVALKQAM